MNSCLWRLSPWAPLLLPCSAKKERERERDCSWEWKGVSQMLCKWGKVKSKICISSRTMSLRIELLRESLVRDVRWPSQVWLKSSVSDASSSYLWACLFYFQGSSGSFLTMRWSLVLTQKRQLGWVVFLLLSFLQFHFFFYLLIYCYWVFIIRAFWCFEQMVIWYFACWYFVVV